MSRVRKGRIAGPAIPGHEIQIPRSNVEPIFGIDTARGDDWGAIAIRAGTVVVLAAAAGAPAQINRDWINGLYAGRKAEREVLAMAFETIAKAHGATVERRTEGRNPGFHSGSISLRIALNGVGANVDFNSLHGGGCALIHWFNTEYPPRDLTQHFASAVRAGSNRSSHKATSFCPDWYGLAMALDAGLISAARGEAFGEPTAP